MKTFCQRSLPLFALLIVATTLYAQPGPGRGFRGGRGPGPGAGRGPGGPDHGPGGEHANDDRHEEDHEVFQFLLTNHEKITRNVKNLPNGVETVTESDDPEVAAMIKDHVHWMKYRIEETHPIRMRDPLFAELFQHTDKITMKQVDTKNGVKVIETSDDPYVAKLIQEHAKVVSGFVAKGFAEAMKNHAVPSRGDSPAASTTRSKEFPNIQKYGGVYPLPNAAQQPRAQSKIVVDVTQGGEPDQLNTAIEKVARFVNLYQGGGQEPAEVQIAVVLHGDATLTVLHEEAYTERFGTEANPNFDCLHTLHEAGVEIYVCGQSLISKGAEPTDVMVFTDVAVSALTSLVNLQADGYRYVPLK